MNLGIAEAFHEAFRDQIHEDEFDLFCQSCGGTGHEASFEQPILNQPGARWYMTINCRECGGRGYLR